jgi:hypothetical protein
MPDGLTSALSSIQPELQAGTAAASIGSTGYNLYNQYQNQQYQNNLRSYAQDPAKMNAYAAQFTQPLNAGLTSAVANNTQGYLAQRGLTDSPAISQQVEAQAIAPYIQQNQQSGYSNALQALGLGGGAVNPNNQSAASIAALAKAFASLPGLGKLTPAQMNSFIQGGAVQPAQLSQSTYTPDYSASADLSAVSMPQLSSDVYTPDYSSEMG